MPPLLDQNLTQQQVGDGDESEGEDGDESEGEDGDESEGEDGNESEGEDEYKPKPQHMTFSRCARQ